MNLNLCSFSIFLLDELKVVGCSFFLFTAYQYPLFYLKLVVVMHHLVTQLLCNVLMLEHISMFLLIVGSIHLTCKFFVTKMFSDIPRTFDK